MEWLRPTTSVATAAGTRKTQVVTILVGSAKIQIQITPVDIVRHADGDTILVGSAKIQIQITPVDIVRHSDGDTIIVGSAKIRIRISLVGTVQHVDTCMRTGRLQRSDGGRLQRSGDAMSVVDCTRYKASTGLVALRPTLIAMSAFSVYLLSVYLSIS